MTTKLPANINPNDLPEIPEQIKAQFKHLTPEEELELRMIAYRTTDFFKWVEAKHAGVLYKRFEEGNTWLDNLAKSIDEHSKKEPSNDASEDEWKAWKKEDSRLRKFHASISDQWLAFSKELRVVAQNHLSREQPKKMEVTQVRVTPGDVANLLNNARKVVDIGNGDDN